MYRGDQVELEQRKVGEIIFRQAIGSKVGQNETHAAKSSRPCTTCTQIRKEDAMCIANDDAFNRPLPIDEQANSPTGVGAKLGEGTRERCGKK